MVSKKINNYIDYEVGDTVSGRHKMAGSKDTKYDKGFITVAFVEESQTTGRGWTSFRDYSKCKTTFSYKCGGGTKRFEKILFSPCELLLIERCK